MAQWHDSLTVPQLVQSALIKLANITGGFRAFGPMARDQELFAFEEIDPLVQSIMRRDPAAIEPVTAELCYMAAETGYAEAWRLLAIARA